MKRLTREKIKALADELARTGPDLNIQTEDEDEGQPYEAVTPERHRAAQAHWLKELAAFKKATFESNPELYRGLKHVGESTVIPQGKPGTAQFYTMLLQRILSPLGASETQTEIAEALLKIDPRHTAPKDWNKPIPSWALKKLRTLITNSVPPFDSIRVTSKTTLASLHATARRRHAVSSGGFRKEVTLLVTADRVFINDKSWKITGPTRRVIIPVRRLLELGD